MSRSVVIVSLRAGDWLDPCLRSVRDQADQLVVVDNGSAGAEVTDVARRFGATVVRSPDNQGFAGGANLGIEGATGDVVALLNDDAVADPAWLDHAEEALADPSVAGVAPKVLLDGWYGQVIPTEDAWFAPSDARPLGRRLTSVRLAGEDVLERLVGPGVHRLESGVVDGRPETWRWTRPGKPYFVPLPGPEPGAAVTVNGETLTLTTVCRLVNNAGLFLRSDGYSGDHGLESPDDGRWDDPRETFGVSGTAMAVRADVFERVGRFAGPFFAYYEDTDWSWRARRLGLRLQYQPASSVSHRRSVTSGQTLGARVRVLGERNRLLSLVRDAPPGWRPKGYGAGSWTAPTTGSDAACWSTSPGPWPRGASWPGDRPWARTRCGGGGPVRTPPGTTAPAPPPRTAAVDDQAPDSPHRPGPEAVARAAQDRLRALVGERRAAGRYEPGLEERLDAHGLTMVAVRSGPGGHRPEFSATGRRARWRRRLARARDLHEVRRGRVGRLRARPSGSSSWCSGTARRWREEPS